MESFENSNRQQSRRAERQRAMQKMEDAAKATTTTTTNATSAEDELPPTLATVRSNNIKVGRNKSSTSSSSSSPWKANTFSDNNDDSKQLDTAMSVTKSASNFLRETQEQHELGSLGGGGSPGGRGLSSSSNNNDTANDTTNKVPSISLLANSKAAKQFLWDDQSSITSGYTSRSNTVNLHDIKHSLSQQQHGSSTLATGSSSTSVSRNKGQRGRGARWSAINARGKELGGGLLNALPLFGGGQQQQQQQHHQAVDYGGEDAHSIASGRSGRSYRDQEGERLLDMASKRLSSELGETQKHSNMSTSTATAVRFKEEISSSTYTKDDDDMEYGEVAGDEIEDDYSFRRPVYLDRDGNLSYYDKKENNTDDIHSRRMMNSYKRSLKRPCAVMLVVLVVGIACIVGVGAGVSKYYHRINHGGGGDDNGYDVSEESEANNNSDLIDSVQLDQSLVGNGNGESGTDQEQPAAAILDKNDKSNTNNKKEDEMEGSSVGEPLTNPSTNNNKGGRPIDNQRFDHIRYTLIKQGASIPNVFLDTKSAQYAALVWLTRDDPRKMDPESVYLSQRYGLAVLWFSTTKSGYEWHVPAEYLGGDAEDDADGNEGEENGSDEEEEETDKEEDILLDQPRKLQQNDPNKWFRHESWLSGSGICGWYGIQCFPHDNNGSNHDGNNDGDISHIELRRNNLLGLIPDELYTTFPYLKVLDLSDNGFAGALNEEKIGGWKTLETLNFTSNNIAGSIISEIGELASLKELYLANNLLEESIPHSVGSLTKLKHLDLSANSLRGTIPFEMGKLKAIGTLDLSWNMLVGPLPHEVSELQTLVTLDVSHNMLGGPLISELSRVTYLTELRLNNNHFSGEMPSEIGNMAHLEELQ